MRILKTTIVLAIVALISGLLIGGAQYWTAPIIERNANERALASYREIYPDLDSEYTENIDVEEGTVYQVVIVKNSSNKLEGYIFRAKDNNQFGTIDIIVVIEPDGKIKNVKILETANTPGFYDKHEDDDGNVKTVKGDSIQNLAGADILAGEASRTGGSLDKMLKDVKRIAPDYMTVEDLPEEDFYENIFGAYKNITDDHSFLESSIVSKKEIIYDADDNILGFAYTAAGKADIPGKDNAKIELLVGVDGNGKVKGVEVLTVEHTKGYVAPHLEVIEGFKDIDLDDLRLDDKADATLSFDLINSLFNAIREAEEENEYANLFGEYDEVVLDDSFTLTKTISKKTIVKDSEGNVLGYGYIATANTTKIPGKDNAKFTAFVAIDNNGMVLGVIELINEHTQNQEGKYYLKYKDIVANLKDIELSELEVEEIVGASISYEILTEIFNAIKEAEGL